ncbi:MAG: type II secretion system protein M [Candidatus Omnitrophica bacterium]|nr:type II secretion system protein M [Candidatus Omnitrophota bacterium]
MNKKLMLFTGYAIAFIILYLLFFVFPTLNRISVLKKTIPVKVQEVQEMQTLKQEYLAAKKEYVPVSSSTQENESIFSLVERIARVRGLADNISSIKPVTSSMPVRTDSSANKEDFQESSVEIRMKNLSLQNLVSYLYTLESTPYNLNIKEIQITSPKEKLSIEVTFIASRLERK